VEHPDRLLELVLWTTLAGACIPAGASLARVERIRPSWLENEFRHFVIAFGGGVLVGAVALVLVPEGARHLPDPLATTALLLTGGAAFMLLDRNQARRRHATPQFAAMAADYLPESLALGGMFAANAEGAVLLALLIGLQNLPEGFNAWRELTSASGKRQGAFALMLGVALLGPVCGLAGWFLLVDHGHVLGGIMLFAAGGILYATFQDIAPQSRLENQWAPPLGAVLGFALALAGHLLL
jgi:ZIP family zinc transporter